MTQPLDDLHPIAREACAQLQAEAEVFRFHQAIDEGRGIFTSLLSTQGVTDPATVRARLDVFNAHAEALEAISPTRQTFMAGVTSGFLLALRLRDKELV